MAQNKEIELYVLKQHTAAVNAVTFYDKDRRFVSASDDCSICVWDTQTRNYLYRLKGHEAAVKALVASEDGTRILSGSCDRTVRVWDGEKSACLWSLQHEGLIMDLSYDQNSSLMSVACDDKLTRVWDLRTYSEVLTLKGHTNSVMSCSQHGNTVATGSLDKTIRVSDIRAANTLLILTGHKGAVSCVDISSEGHKLCSASWDKTVRLWDIHAGTYRTQGPRVMYEHEGCVSSSKFACDDQKIISGGYDNLVIVWDALHAKKRHNLRAHESWITDCAMTNDGNWLLTCSKDRTLRMWDMDGSDNLPVVLNNKMSMGYKFQECDQCQRTFKVEKKDMIEVGEDVLRCVYCRMPDRAYNTPSLSHPGACNVGGGFAVEVEASQDICT